MEMWGFDDCKEMCCVWAAGKGTSVKQLSEEYGLVNRWFLIFKRKYTTDLLVLLTPLWVIWLTENKCRMQPLRIRTKKCWSSSNNKAVKEHQCPDFVVLIRASLDP